MTRTADAVLAADPGRSVVVLDKESALGAHASGRNSGVLHAGFSYEPDSLKARLTRRGNQLLHAFCDEHAIPVNRCGKLVVAQRPEDLPALDQLLARATANAVPVDGAGQRFELAGLCLVDELDRHGVGGGAREELVQSR